LLTGVETVLKERGIMKGIMGTEVVSLLHIAVSAAVDHQQRHYHHKLRQLQ